MNAGKKDRIKAIKIWHHSIMDHIITLGPHFSLKELSLRTGYTIPWLSTLMQTDAFKAALVKRRDAFEAGIASDLGARLTATTNQTLEKIQEMLPMAISLSAVTDTAGMLLEKLGYGSKHAPAPVQQPAIIINNQPMLPSAVILQARQNFFPKAKTAIEAVTESEVRVLSPPDSESE